MRILANKREKYPLHQSPFYRLCNRRKLALLLGISAGELRQLGKRNPALYSEFSVPKKNGGTRGVENPRRDLKLVQARIARLLCRVVPPDYLFCPVKKRCYVTNAAKHRHQRIVHCLDVKKYYPSTSSRRVYWFFNSVMKCTPDIAGLLTSVATYKDHLPTGSPLSPILAYFAFHDLWEDIARRCKEQRCRLTVYIDDVTLSGSTMPAEFIWSIRQAIHRAGLRYHKEKHYVGRPAEITGVIVDGGRLAVPHRQLKKLHATRQELASAKSNALTRQLEGKVAGMLGQIKQINSAQRQFGHIGHP
ncbi:MAG TPA: reverse transcriptase family protein [Roseiarcus sp.]|jgi:retron-type reverse transcriptase